MALESAHWCEEIQAGWAQLAGTERARRPLLAWVQHQQRGGWGGAAALTQRCWVVRVMAPAARTIVFVGGGPCQRQD
jgi:hypothetical protein